MKTTEEIVNGVLESHQRKYEDAFQILDKSPTDEQIEAHLFSLGFSQDCVRRYLNSNASKYRFNPAWFNVDSQGGHDDTLDALGIRNQVHRSMFGSSLGRNQAKTTTASQIQAADQAQRAALQNELLKIHGINVDTALTDPFSIIRPDTIQPILRKDIP